MKRSLPFIGILLILFCLTAYAQAQTSQTVGNGAPTAPVNFTGAGCVFNWVNNTPGIGLAASGTGNIPSFTAINTGSGPVTATITVTPAPQDALAYIINQTTNSVSVINTAINSVVTTIPVRNLPFAISVSHDGSLVYVAHFIGSYVTVISSSTNKVIDTIPVLAAGSISLATSPDGKLLYVGTGRPPSNGNTQYIVQVIDILSKSLITNIVVGQNPFDILVSPDGSRIYTANGGSNNVTVINATTNTVITTVPVDVGPREMVLSLDGSKLFVVNSNTNTVSVIDLVSYSVTATIPVGLAPISIALSPDGSRIFVVNNQSNDVSVINTATNSLVSSTFIPVGKTPEGVSFTPDGKEAYVVNSGSNSVSVINTATNIVSTTITGGAMPFSVPDAMGSNFITNSPPCTSAPFTFTITVNVGPTITTGAVTGNIAACAGSASVSPNIGQFTVSGSTLTGDITATAPRGFELSLAPGGGYGGSVILTKANSVVSNSPIYIRSAIAASPGNLSGNVVLTSPGATSQNVAVTGVVNTLPVAAFTVSAITCSGNATVFKDVSAIASGSTAKTWLWDFGDGQTSTVQNPTHIYAAAGNYNVVLTVADNIGCSATSSPINVHVTAQPVANFTASATDCPGQSIMFTDNSTSTDGTIIQWAWSFGDGQTSTQTSNQPITHLYAATGTDTVKLTITTDKGCVSNVFAQVLTIHPLPEVDFTLPNVCLADAYAQFTDKSTIADGTQSVFTYLWDFGDATSTPANNMSALQNPKHKYSKEGNYTATLTVTSKYGCATIKSQPFTVNGAVPLAGFTVENKNNLCSTDSVTFDDQSSVDFGNITRIVWFFDYNNHPTDSVVYTTATMHTDKKYRYYYGLFNSPLQQNYAVMMIAYSGQVCKNVLQQTITINANPIVTLSPATNITLCQADNAIQITENKNGFTGTGIFSGTGVSSTGLFDPKIAGTGVFTINYLFTASNTGCTYSKTLQVIVNPTPVVSVPGAELTLLEGGQVNLNAKATITSGTMTYKWSPAIGLNQDNILNPIANPANDILYTLTATSDKYCSATTQVLVKVLKSPVVPNAFTPNGDGINDTWNIQYLDSYPNATVEIFNRNGEQVYFSHNYPIPWNGTYKGSKLPDGTYYYIINPNSGRKAISGYVTIIR